MGIRFSKKNIIVNLHSDESSVLNCLKIKSNFDIIEGRCYETIDNTSYILPNDESEIGRLNYQHYFLKHTFNGNFKAPIKKLLQKGINVLDIGCASGAWCLDMANDFDNNTYWGIDISEKFPNDIKPINCNFKVGNIIKDFPLQQNYFDFVHQRLLVAGIPSKDWLIALNNIKIGLKNNGWLQFVECYIKPFNSGPKFKKLMDNVINILEIKKLDPYIAKRLNNILIEDGNFKNIKEDCIDIPINWNGKIGEMHANDWNEIFQSLKPGLKSTVETSDFDTIIKEAIDECKVYETYFKWYIVYGQYYKS